MTMKIIICLVSLVFIESVVWPQQRKSNDLLEAGLFGRVKSVKVEEAAISWKSGKYEERGKTLQYTTIFNEKGNKIEFIRHSFIDGSIQMKESYKRDMMDKLTQVIEYDHKGRIQSKVTIVYDVKGQATEEAKYNADGSLNSRFTFAYDSMGNIIKEIAYNADGSFNSQSTYSLVYDAKGNLIETTAYKMGNSPTFKIQSKFSDAGKVTERIEYIYDTDGNLESEAEVNFDSMGNKAEYVEYNENEFPKRSSFTYEFDKTGNWIKRKTSSASSRVEYRIIEYFQ